jgi:hypothetical protein
MVLITAARDSAWSEVAPREQSREVASQDVVAVSADAGVAQMETPRATKERTVERTADRMENPVVLKRGWFSADFRGACTTGR